MPNERTCREMLIPQRMARPGPSKTIRKPSPAVFTSRPRNRANLRRPMLNNSSPGQAIYEPFLGSGTTLIAAQSCGRVCFGIEIDPLFVDLAIRRWQSFAGENARRASDGVDFDVLAPETQTVEETS
jgi:DNA methylase